jgi:hypothetical protein
MSLPRQMRPRPQARRLMQKLAAQRPYHCRPIQFSATRQFVEISSRANFPVEAID